MVCDISTEKKDLSLSELIKILYEFEGIDALFDCVKTLKDEVSLDELENMSDEEIYMKFLKSNK